MSLKAGDACCIASPTLLDNLCPFSLEPLNPFTPNNSKAAVGSEWAIAANSGEPVASRTDSPRNDSVELMASPIGFNASPTDFNCAFPAVLLGSNVIASLTNLIVSTPESTPPNAEDIKPVQLPWVLTDCYLAR